MNQDLECAQCGIYLSEVGGSYACLQEDPYVPLNFCGFSCMIRGLLYRVKEEIVYGDNDEYKELGNHLVYLLDSLLSLNIGELCKEELDEFKGLLKK